MDKNAAEATDITRLFAKYSGGLCLYARQMLADSAEDAVQESFVKLLCCKTKPDNVKAWLYRTLRNECITRLRKNKVRSEAAEKIKAQSQNWFQTDTDSSLDIELLQQKLASLDEPLREVVTLRIWGQLGFEEIADVTGLPVSTLHNRYHKAINTLRTMLT